MKSVSVQRFAFLRKLFFFLCFMAFPFFLLHISLSSYFSLARQEKFNQISGHARKNLLKMSDYADGAKFFERVLDKHLNDIPQGPTQKKVLEARIKQLKKKFPATFEFVVWNADGKLDKKLTDNPSFVVFLKRLNQFLIEVRKVTLNSFPGRIAISGELTRAIRNFRQLLGPFIPTEKIAASFLPTQNRRCFMMHGKGPRAFGWFTLQPGYSILAYLNYDSVRSLLGPKMICKKHNSFSTDTKLYIIDEDLEDIFPRAPRSLYNKILLNLGKKKMLVPSELLQSDDRLFSFQTLKPGVWGVAYTDLTGLKKFDSRAELILFRVAALLAILFVVLKSFFLVHANPFDSIRYKLFLVFVYTVAVPVMIFSTVGFDYISQKTTRAESEQGAKLLQTLNSFDQQFNNYQLKIADQITRFLNDQIKRRKLKVDDKEKWLGLARDLQRKFLVDAILIFDSEGNELLEKELSKEFLDPVFPKSLAVDLLAFLNDRKLDTIRQVKIMTEPSLIAFNKTRNNITFLSLAERQFFFFNHDIQLKDPLHTELCIQMFWDLRRMQNGFFAELCKRFESNSSLKPIMYFNDTGAISPESEASPELINFLKKVEIQGAQFERLQLDKSDFLAAGFVGPNMINAVTGAAMDYKIILESNENLKKSISFLLLIALVFSLALYLLLSQQILKPVEKLSKGVEKVRQLDFNYRIDLNSENEFGALAKSVNHTLENLAELEIAKVVQEALLPEENLKHGSFEVFGRTLPMNKLGGDYFDFFVDKNDVLHVFIADAAGHGVQSALMMAMAKSVLLLESDKDFHGEQIMEALNQTFLHLRQSEIKTMMTGQLLQFSQNRVSFFNAGHCFPLVTGYKDREINEIRQGSFPFGYTRKRQFKATEVDFASGSVMVLFTDGIIESLNQYGETFGIERFNSLISQSFDFNLETFYDNIIEGVKSWQAKQEDDLTIVLVRNNHEPD